MYTELQKMQVMIATIFKGVNVKVKKVIDESIYLSFENYHDLEQFNRLLKSSNLLKSTVSHGIWEKKLEIDEITQLTALYSEPKIKLKYDGIKDFVENVFDNEFLNYAELSGDMWNNFSYDSSTGIGSLTITGTISKVKRETAKFEMLQHALSNSKIIDILHLSTGLHEPVINLESDKSDKLLNDESVEMSVFAKDILNVKTSEDGRESYVIFNTRILLQELQNKYFENSPPILVTESSNNNSNYPLSITLKKDTFFKYLENSFESGIIFDVNDKVDSMTPIAFSSKKFTQETHSFSALIDISGSMVSTFSKYVEGIKKIFKNITSKVKDGNITITAFNHETLEKVFSLNDSEIESKINIFIDALKADGKTNLNGTIIKSISKSQNIFDKQNTLIIFTDGLDTERLKTDKEVITAMSLAGENPCFQMYSLGFGKNYNERFFTDIANTNGFKHFHLEDVDNFADFHQHLRNIESDIILCTVVTEIAQHFKKRLQSGELEILEEVPLNSKVVFNIGRKEITYKAGKEEDLPNLNEESLNLNEEFHTPVYNSLQANLNEVPPLDAQSDDLSQDHGSMLGNCEII